MAHLSVNMYVIYYLSHMFWLIITAILKETADKKENFTLKHIISYTGKWYVTKLND